MHLLVGGRSFEIATEDLDEGLFGESLLKALVEGDSRAEKYVVNRDPHLFEEVLELLRGGRLEAPVEPRLAEELRYWSLPSLLRQGIRQDLAWKERVPGWLLREREEERAVLLSRESPPGFLVQLDDSHFDPARPPQSSKILRCLENVSGLTFPKDGRYPGMEKRLAHITQRPTGTHNSIEKAVMSLTMRLGYFARLVREGLFVLAGGAVTAALLGTSFSDYDLFPLAPAEEVLPHIKLAVEHALSAGYDVIYTRLSATIDTGSGKFQFILAEHENVDALLTGFDVDCCCVAFDGRGFLATPRGLRALRTRTNFVDPCRHLVDRGYNFRLCKYLNRGVMMWIPYFDLCEFEFKEHLRQIRPKDVTGARELLFLLGVSYERAKNYWKSLDSTGIKPEPCHKTTFDQIKGFSRRGRSFDLNVPTDWHDQLLMTKQEVATKYPASEPKSGYTSEEIREYILQKTTIEPFSYPARTAP